jgi:hypothetical protein
MPVSGQDLAEKNVKKGPMKIMEKAVRALEILEKINLGGVGDV